MTIQNDLERTIFKCQQSNLKLDKCFLSDDNEVKCSYMGKKIKVIIYDQNKNPYLTTQYLCDKGKEK